MRILGLDIGSKRIGVAISDALGIIAQAHSTLEREKCADIVELLKEIVKREGVEEIVVGLPLNMDGSYGSMAKEVISFSDNLKEKLNIPIKLWDERMSTIQVERLMIKGDLTRRKRKKRIDKLAAQVVLQSYLDAQKKV